MSSVPNTTTFNFQNVTSAVYGDTASGRNLSASFTNANNSFFNPTYVGSKDRLYNFRDYGPHHGTIFYVEPEAITVRYTTYDAAYIDSDESWTMVGRNFGAGPWGWFDISPTFGGSSVTHLDIIIWTTAMASYVGEAFFENVSSNSISFQVTYSYWHW